MQARMSPNRFMNYSLNVFSIANAFFSIIVMYFIYLYSSSQAGSGWAFLALLAKIYLIIAVAILCLFVLLGIIFFITSLALLMSFVGRRR